MQAIKKIKNHKNKYLAYLALALTILAVTPIDDILISSIFGGALFGFGTFEFYFFTILISTASVLIWVTRRRKTLQQKEENIEKHGMRETTCAFYQN